jgi:ribosomal protein L11 methyltransferase
VTNKNNSLLKIQVHTSSDAAAEAAGMVLEQMGVEGISFECLPKAAFTSVCGYHPEPEKQDELVADLEKRIKSLEQFDLFIGAHEITCSIIVRENWEESWKEFFKPMRIGKRLIVSPTWEKVDLANDDILLSIDPQNAFGTGQHPTTALCLRALERHCNKDSSVFDIGCGSGILTIASAKLCAPLIASTDNDPDAIEVTLNNLKVHSLDNRLNKDIFVFQGSLAADGINYMPEKGFKIVVANILSHIVEQAAVEVPGVLADDGIFITSGIIDTSFDSFMSVMTDLGYKAAEICREAEWYQVTFKYVKNR